MMKKRMCSCVMATALLFTASVTCAAEPKVSMAKLCGTCHQAQPGVMMGFLDNISLRARSVQMDFLSHKEVVKFDDHTVLKNVLSFEDIRNYTNKGFAVHFVEKDGEKLASSITRFDVLKTIESGEYKVEKLTREQFNEWRQAPNTVVYDVRPPMLYQASHIPGAKSLPAPAFDKFKGTLPQDRATPIVLYDVGGCLSPTVAFTMKSMGYDSVAIFMEGFPGWARTDFGVTTVDWLKQAVAGDLPHVLIDLRDKAEVGSGHIKGAVSLPVASLERNRDTFPEQKNAPIVLYGPDREKAAETILSWGYRDVRILPVTFEQWQSEGNPVTIGKAPETISYVPKPKPGTVSIAEFQQAAGGVRPDTVLIDVRNPEEVAKGKISGSVNIPADLVGQRVDEIPAGKDIILFCPSGVRSEMAYNILDQKGVRSRYLDAFISIAENGGYELREK
jgi:rhodanese-related sulfurtransferase